MKPPVVIKDLSQADAQQVKLIFESGGATVVLVPNDAGTFTLVATYPNDGAGIGGNAAGAGDGVGHINNAPLPGPVPALAASPFVAELVRVCVQEWNYFGQQQYGLDGTLVAVGHKEQEAGYAARIGTYFEYGTSTHGIDGNNTDWAWSAAFISWIMKTTISSLALDSKLFRYSTKHSVYISQAIRDRSTGRADAGYWCNRLNEYQPSVGDLLCWARESGVDYDNQKSGWYDGHCDLVVEVSPDKIWVIGGNVGNSITKRPIQRAPSGYLSPIAVGGETLFGIMQCRIGVGAAQGVAVQVNAPQAPGPAVGPAGVPADGVAGIKIAWGQVISPELKQRVVDLANILGCDPSHVTASMAFETGESFSPTAQNPVSHATGLIQFMPSTASALGTSVDALLNMTAVQQMDYVGKYFAPYAGRMKTLSDVYMAILWPKAIGTAEATSIFELGTPAYTQNAGLDVNHDGIVTKGEAASKVQGKLDKGLSAQLLG